MKKKKNKLIPLWGLLFILLIILFIFVISNIKYFNDNAKLKSDDKGNDVEEVTKDNYKLSLIMVGDNLIHSSIYEEANKNANYQGYDFSSMYEMIKPIVSNYDIAYYNQETILGGSDIGVSTYPSFNSPYEVGDAMIDAGFNLVSLATNHTLDRGEVAVLNSREYWNKFENVLAVGSYSSYEEKEKIQVREVNNITYTMLNYTYGTNGIPVASGKEYLVNVWPVSGSNPNTDSSYQNYKQTVLEDISKVRDKVDVLIVAMHWGVEYENMPSEYQIDMANFLSENGVDIIIGTHPHVIQPVTWINDTLVLYSLGNFASAHEVVNIANRIGLMTSLEIEKDINTNKISINNVENELLYMYYTPSYTDFKIIPFSMLNDDYLFNYKDIYNEYKNIVTSMNSEVNVKNIS